MLQAPLFESTFDYSRKLFDAGLCGLQAGEASALRGKRLSPFLLESAKTPLMLGAGAALLGLLASGASTRRRAHLKAVACGALAFSAAFFWATRSVSLSGTRRALKEVARVRDQHWLELNPIDYA